MEPYGRGAAAAKDAGTGLEDSMWQLRLGASPPMLYPERPGEPNCAYYLRTGSCAYGDRCRYNHPLDRGDVAGAGRIENSEYPERAGQPACQYFLKTGTCKYGATCKYDHPRQGGPVPIAYNFLGYPLRPGEKECSYYMRSGQCKFGATCKFNHPHPDGASVPSSPSAFYSGQPPSVPSPQGYPTIDVARPAVLPSSYIPGPYGPLLVSPGIVPVPGWTPYPPQVSSPVASSGGESLYRSSNQLSPTAPSYQGIYQSVQSAVETSGNIQNEHLFPERPGEPECQYYMRTGDCKFGSTCKYHHPPERSTSETNCILSPVGLPLRPGAPLCTYYAQHRLCKFGPACKFDHPMGTPSYNFTAPSFTDMPDAPYPVGFSTGTIAASSSSSEPRSEFMSNKDGFTTRMQSSEGTPSGSVGSVFPKGSYLPHSMIQFSSQTSALSSSDNSTGHNGNISNSN